MKFPTRGEVLDPRNTHEKKIGTYEIPIRKTLGPTKYPQEKMWDPRDTHEKKIGTHEIPTKAPWRNGTRPTRPTMAHKPRNSPHSNDSLTHSLAYSLICSFAYSLAHFLTNSPTLPCLIVRGSNKMNQGRKYQNFLKLCA